MADNEFDKSKIESKVPMRRYFLVSFAHKSGFGAVSLITDGVFPSFRNIKDTCIVSNVSPAETILNIFEFKSESDYNQFIKE